MSAIAPGVRRIGQRCSTLLPFFIFFSVALQLGEMKDGKVGLLFLSRPARASLLQHGHTHGCSTSALLSVPEDIAAFDMLAVSALISLQILSAVTAMIIYFQRNYLAFFLTHEFFCK